MQSAQTFEKRITKTLHLDYLLFLPQEYGQDPAKRWPLILFLHGAGERGNNLNKVKKHGIPKIVETKPDFPFITVSPQCPKESWWPMELESLVALLDDVTTRYAVDPKRIYLTGLSMGGYGTWHLALLLPERFAAIVPICGGLHGPAQLVEKLKHLPIWVFHGARDRIVPLEESTRLVKVLRNCGGNVRLTIYPNAGHDAWTRTYENPELYEWLLAHSRK